MEALYLTSDGLLEHLGYGQVVRVVTGLARRGVRYHVLSLERDHDLARKDAVDQLKAELQAVGVEWTPLRYTIGHGWPTALGNMRRMMSALRRLRRTAEVVHARGYHAAFAALFDRASTLRKKPVLFDTRSYWFDERREQGRWFSNDRLFAGVKELERRMYEGASGIVTLTELSAQDVRTGRLGRVARSVPVEVIPTVVDFEAFDLDRGTARAMLAARFPSLGEGPVIGFVGSVNNWYRVDDSLSLVAHMMRLDPSIRFLGLSAAHEELDRRLNRLGVPASARLCTQVEHRDMPAWIAALDWGLLFLNSSYAKRASMPTKLGEFLAGGVAPIHTGCNEEVGTWVKKTESGLTLDTLVPSDLPAVAERLVRRGPPTTEARIDARRMAHDHFSLDGALDRYDRLLRAIDSTGSTRAA